MRPGWAPSSSTYFHRRVTHLTALRVFRLGAWSAVMLVHHKGRATMSEGPARPTEGSLFAATGGRRRRLTMSRHRQRAASYPETAKNDHMYHSPMKVSTGPSIAQLWRASNRCRGRSAARALNRGIVIDTRFGDDSLLIWLDATETFGRQAPGASERGDFEPMEP